MPALAYQFALLSFFCQPRRGRPGTGICWTKMDGKPIESDGSDGWPKLGPTPNAELFLGAFEDAHRYICWVPLGTESLVLRSLA